MTRAPTRPSLTCPAAAHPCPRVQRLPWLVTFVLLLVLASAASPARADSTPAPTPLRGLGSTATPCPSGQTPTRVTSPAPRTTAKPSARATADSNATTYPDGHVERQACAVAPPLPLPGPVVAPEHTVGGPQLARTGVVVDAPPGTPPAPELPFVSYVLADLATGEVLAAKSAHARLYPASTLKSLTALVALPALDPRQVVVGAAEDAAAEGTRVGILPGNPYTVDDLFNGLLMVSGNDAAYAIARAYGGRVKLVADMNAQAAQLGAWDTVVVDPSGLDADGQRSSAYDLALVGRAVMQLPEFRRHAVLRTAQFPGGLDATGRVIEPFQIQNHNPIIDSYPGTIGIKNGYTTKARNTFIGAVTRGGRTLLLAEMGSVDRGAEPTKALLDWAFANAGALRPIGTLVDPGTTPRPPELSAAADSAGVGPAPGGTATAAPETGLAIGLAPQASAGAAPADSAAPMDRATTGWSQLDLLWQGGLSGTALLLLAGAGLVAWRRRRRTGASGR